VKLMIGVQVGNKALFLKFEANEVTDRGEEVRVVLGEEVRVVGTFADKFPDALCSMLLCFFFIYMISVCLKEKS